MFHNNACLPTEVALSYPLSQSQLGHYFIGETPLLSGENTHTLATLSNPSCSGVAIYPNAITITNTSSVSIFAEIYIGCYVNTPFISHTVSCVNSTIHPKPVPHGEIQYLPNASTPPIESTVLFSRIVPPLSTLVIDGGQIILAPDTALTVYIGGKLPVVFDGAIVALGWWEESLASNACCY